MKSYGPFSLKSNLFFNNLLFKTSRANIILIIVYFAKQTFQNKGQSLIDFPYPMLFAFCLKQEI